MATPIVLPGFIALSAMLCACSHSEGGRTSGPPTVGLPSAGEISAVPMGHIADMTDSAALARSIPNPYAGNAQAIAEGKSLYIKMNCAGCHAYNAKGNMGPDLTDTYWRYGGLPAQIYQSIHDGRAQGMPAWGLALPPQEIWKLVAYIQSLGGTYSADGTPRSGQGTELVAPELHAHDDDDSASASSAHGAPETPAPPASVPTTTMPPDSSPAGATTQAAARTP